MYANWGQLLAAVSLVFWSLVPVYFPELSAGRELSLFVVTASLTVLVIGLYQQAARYIDTANSLEDSARKIDGLRRHVQAAILAGLDRDPKTFADMSSEYTRILDENPENHLESDYAIAGATRLACIIRFVLLHARASPSFILTLLVVVAVPLAVISTR